MADYNTTVNMPPQWEGSRLRPRAGVMVRYASNGAARVRALQSAAKYDPVVEHSLMTTAQRDALLAFYTANRGLTFTFTLTGDTQRTCVFGPSAVQITPLGGSALYKATVDLVEV